MIIFIFFPKLRAIDSRSFLESFLESLPHLCQVKMLRIVARGLQEREFNLTTTFYYQRGRQEQHI